jgi:hypothetical protein
MAGGGGGGGGGGSDPTAYHSGDANLTPVSDNFQTLGTALKSLKQIISNLFSVFKAPGDANPSAQISDGALKLGKGGATALKFNITQTATDGVALIQTGSKLQQTDAPTVGADLVNKTYADGLAGGGPFTLVQTIDVLADADTVTFAGLAGDTDDYYVLIATLLTQSGAGDNYHLQPNGSDANLASTIMINTGAALVAASEAIFYLVEAAGAGTYSGFRAELAAKSGVKRWGFSNASRGIGTANQGNLSNVFWDDLATVITSLVVFADGGTGHGIGAGSVLSLYKLTQ